jgi:hypothetical protein
LSLLNDGKPCRECFFGKPHEAEEEILKKIHALYLQMPEPQEPFGIWRGLCFTRATFSAFPSKGRVHASRYAKCQALSALSICA